MVEIKKPNAKDDVNVANKEVLSSMIIEIPDHPSSINQHSSDYQIH